MSNASAKRPEVQDLRRRNLRAFLVNSGMSNQAFASLCGISASRLSQLISPASEKGFSDKTAEDIEKTKGWPVGTLSRPDGLIPSDNKLDPAQSVMMWEAIGEVAKEKGVTPRRAEMAEVLDIAARAANRTGLVDVDLVKDLARKYLKK